MISLFIFYIHTIAAVWLFTKRWQEAEIKEGILAVGFLALVFSVGWSISAFVVGLFMEKEGFGVWLDRDACSLLLLSVMEALFFSVQLRRKKKKTAIAG